MDKQINEQQSQVEEEPRRSVVGEYLTREITPYVNKKGTLFLADKRSELLRRLLLPPFIGQGIENAGRVGSVQLAGEGAKGNSRIPDFYEN